MGTVSRHLPQTPHSPVKPPTCSLSSPSLKGLLGEGGEGASCWYCDWVGKSSGWRCQSPFLVGKSSKTCSHTCISKNLKSILHRDWYILVINNKHFIPECCNTYSGCCSVAQSCPTLWPHGLQHARLPCPSPTPGACSNSCSSSRLCHPTISSCVIPFSCLQSFPASGSFPVSWHFTYMVIPYQKLKFITYGSHMVHQALMRTPAVLEG